MILMSGHALTPPHRDTRTLVTEVWGTSPWSPELHWDRGHGSYPISGVRVGRLRLTPSALAAGYRAFRESSNLSESVSISGL